MYVYVRCFVQCYRAHCVMEMLILLSWQKRFYVYAYTIYIYIITRCMYNGALYAYINVCTYMQPRWNALHLLCSWPGNGPDFLNYVNCPREQMLAYALQKLRLKKPRKMHKWTTSKLNSVALVRMRTIPTERPPPVGEVSANFCR